MALRVPSEIVVERVLPTVRAALAAELHDRGQTQAAIADALGITQAAISKHLAGDVTIDERIAAGPGFEATIERLADGIENETMDEFDVLSELVGLIDRYEDRGPICAIHEAEMPALEGLGCDLCVRGPDERRRTERSIIADVRRAGRRFAAAEGMATAVPNVGTNIGMALPDAEAVTDVAAIPGRVYAMRGSVVVPADPEFGASEHVATTILAAMGVSPSLRGAVNIATDETLIERAADVGLSPTEFDPAYEDRDEALHTAFRSVAGGEPPRIVYHRGAFGIEPVTYVLGRSASAAVDRAVTLLADGDSA